MREIRFSLLLLLLTGCASSLKDKSQLGETPDKMKQKIEAVPEASLVANPTKSSDPTTLGAVASLPAVVKTKTVKKKKKGVAAKNPEAEEAATVRPPQPGFQDKWPFSLNEKSTYVIRYGPLEGGRATIEVAAPQKIEGEMALHYVVNARTARVFELFYKVEDRLESWVRLKDHLPLRQEILQNESGEWGRRVVIFDQKKHEQHFYSSTTRPGREPNVIDERHPLHNNPQDILGSFFFGRFIKDPKKITFPVHDRFKHWNNEYTFDGKEEIKTKAGTFMCNRYKVYPRVQGNLEPQGDALVWMSDDDRRIMTKFKVKIKIGSITGDLVAYEPGQPWDLRIPYFATPIDLDPGTAVSNDEIKDSK